MFIIDIIVAACIVYIVYIPLSEYAFRRWKAIYKSIEKEWSLLDALLEDYDEVSRLADQITQKASKHFDSGLIQAGLAVQLNAEQKRWIATARNFVGYIKSFQELKKKRKFPWWLVSVVIYLPKMYGVIISLEWSNDVLKKKTCADIYGSVEQSRSKVRSLQDRSIVVESRPPPPVGLSQAEQILISSLKKPADLHRNGMEEQIMKSFIMELQLLHAFLKDIRRLKVLETNMQISWVIAANKTIYKTKDAVATIHNSTMANQKSLQKLKTDIMYFRTRISDLLKSKEISGFKFIRREPSKSAAYRSDHSLYDECHQTTGAMDFLSASKDIRNWLSRVPLASTQLSSDVTSLRKQLECMQKLFEDTKATEDGSNARDACLEQLKKLAPEAEQYSKTHEEDSNQCLSEFIKRLEKDVIVLQRHMKLYSIEARKESCSVVGLEEDIHELVLRLTTKTESEKCSHIAILGMEGIGKTTLAKQVFHHRTIANHFEVCRWVSIPQWSNENALFRCVRNQVLLDMNQEEQSGKDYWIKKVRDFLQKKKCLLVFDNSLSRKPLDALIAAFPAAEITNGSRIVLTTRRKAFADHSHAPDHPNNTIQWYPLRLRTQEESWEFFTQMVHISSEKELITKSKKLVGETGGLPLVIFRLGYLLSHAKSVTSEELSWLRERITYGRNQSPWLDTKELNKKDLQEGYFELFPGGESEIPARRLVALWVAKELVADHKSAYKHLLELIDRNMIQIVQRKPNGGIKTCCLPSALRELLLRDKGNSSTNRSWSLSASSDQQHIAYHFDDNDASFSRINGLNTNSPNVLQCGGYPHSILFFDTREGDKPGEEIGDYLRRGIARGFFRKLKVLDLERVFKPQLPKTIGKLKQLTYLGLRWTYVETIPESIGNLENLETLDLKHTHLQTLPSSIWKLKKLRHLYLNQNCLIKFSHIPFALQTLSGAFLGKGNFVKGHLDKLKDLQELGLVFQLGLREQEELAKWIEQLTKLESLKLTSGDEKSAPQPLRLKALSKLEKLSSLYLSGKLEKPGLINQLPRSLTHITLSATEITKVSMPILGKLPNLKSLSLISDSYQGTAIVCSKDDFPQLFVLKLWNLDSLEKLDVEKGAMQNLRELEIRSCSNLTTTTGLTNLKILQEIKLTNMPKKCTDDIEDGFAAAVVQSAGKIHSPAIKIEYWKPCQMKH